MTRYYYCLIVTVLFLWGALSDERMGLSFVSAADPCQRSLSRVRVPSYSRPYFTVSDLRLPFRRLLRLAGSRWRYSTPPPHLATECFPRICLSGKIFIEPLPNIGPIRHNILLLLSLIWPIQGVQECVLQILSVIRIWWPISSTLITTQASKISGLASGTRINKNGLPSFLKMCTAFKHSAWDRTLQREVDGNSTSCKKFLDLQMLH
jgi:hypothetical protein